MLLSQLCYLSYEYIVTIMVLLQFACYVAVLARLLSVRSLSILLCCCPGTVAADSARGLHDSHVHLPYRDPAAGTGLLLPQEAHAL